VQGVYGLVSPHNILMLPKFALYRADAMPYPAGQMRPNDDRASPHNGQTTERPNVWARVEVEQVGLRANERTRVTVAEAAQLLGLSAEAVRSRVKRGTLDSIKTDGKVYVLLDDERTQHHSAGVRLAKPDAQVLDRAPERLIGSMQDQIDYLRRELDVRNEELRRKDHLLAAALEGVRQLQGPRAGDEAPADQGDTSHGSEPASEGEVGVRTAASSQEPERRRSWLARFFFGP
jgi:hypothetical protein